MNEGSLYILAAPYTYVEEEFEPTVQEYTVSQSPTSPTTVQYQLDAQEVLTTIRMHLEGWTTVIDPETGEQRWVKREEFRMLNEKGVNAVLKVVAGVMHKIVFLSKLSKGKIEEFAQEVHRQVAKMLFERYEEFEIEDPRYIPVITLIVGMNVYAAMMRAEGGMTSEKITEVQRTIERIVSSGGKSFLPWGRD